MIREDKNCYTCDNKRCNITYSCIRQDVTEHHEVSDIDIEFDCVNHNKWEPLFWREKQTREKKMVEADLNNGSVRKIDLFNPVYCVKCKKEIIRDVNSVNLNINVRTCGYAFCKECNKKFNEFAGKKLADYERKLVEEFIKE